MTEAMTNPDVKESDLNRSQGLVHIMNSNVMYAVWPRAGGKTSGGIGPRIVHLSEVMPRSQVGLISDTFERIDKVLLPGLESYWMEELGLIPDIDYVIHKKPPEHWTKPLFIPKKFDHVVTFASGFCLCEISLSVSGSGNGFNLQAIIGDEIKYWDEKKFKSEVKPAIRGARKLFGDLPEFQSQWYFTDKYPSKGANIDWVLAKKKLATQDIVDIVYTLQMKIYQLQEEATKYTSNEKKYEYKHRIEEIEEVLRLMRIDMVYYCDALPYENKEVLGDKYFRDQKRDLTKFEYEVAIENKDPDKAEKPFYPDLAAIHYYESNRDYNLNKPLIMALDYQFSITPICVAQYDRLDDSIYSTLNFIESMHVLDPLGIEAALALFCDRFKDHGTKIVYYIFDHTAIGRSPHGKTFKDLVIDYLTLNGWSVIDVYTGDAPDHEIKWEKIKYWLNVQADQAIRINAARNEYLKISLEKSPAKIIQGKTKKDKSSEKENSGIPPEKATHFSDTFDQIVWGALELQMVPLTDDPGMDITIGGRK